MANFICRRSLLSFKFQGVVVLIFIYFLQISDSQSKYYYVGCFRDHPEESLAVRNTWYRSITKCITRCFQEGYRFVGIQKTDGINCSCSSGFENYFHCADEVFCTCNVCGKSDYLCGKENATAIYDIVQGSNTYDGCYNENPENRDLSEMPLLQEIMSSGICKEHCYKAGYAFAGLSYSAESFSPICYCSATIGKYGRTSESQCDRFCEGNFSYTCGGYLSTVVSVYRTDFEAMPSLHTAPTLVLDDGMYLHLDWKKLSSTHDINNIALQIWDEEQRAWKNLTTTIGSTSISYSFTIDYKINDTNLTQLALDMEYNVRIVISGQASPSLKFTTCPEINNLPVILFNNGTSVLFMWKEIPNTDSYEIYVWQQNSRHPLVVNSRIFVNEHWVHNLQPNTAYRLHIAIHRNKCLQIGPQLIFQTSCTVPSGFPVVTQVQTEVMSSDNFKAFANVSWKAPSILNCDRIVRLQYFLKNEYLNITRRNDVYEDALDNCSCFIITDLNLKTLYTLQISVENDGFYQSSPSLPYSFSSIETVPGNPAKITLKEKSETNLIVQWDPPQHVFSKIGLYKLELSAVKSYNQKVNDLKLQHECSLLTFNTTVDGIMLEYNFDNLYSATQYNITIWAISEKGQGPPIFRLFWTDVGDPVYPNPPQWTKEDMKDNTITITLMLIEDLPEGPVSGYRIVVNPLFSNVSINKSFLWDYWKAKEFNLPYYITAELPKNTSKVFVIGDGKMYGGFYNAPLKNDTDYEVLFGIVSSIDSSTKTSYVNAYRTNLAVEYLAVDSSSNVLLPIGIIVCIIFFILIAVILFVIIKVRRDGSGRYVPVYQKSDMVLDDVNYVQWTKYGSEV